MVFIWIRSIGDLKKDVKSNSIFQKCILSRVIYHSKQLNKS